MSIPDDLGLKLSPDWLNALNYGLEKLRKSGHDPLADEINQAAHTFANFNPIDSNKIKLLMGKILTERGIETYVAEHLLKLLDNILAEIKKVKTATAA